MKEMIKRNKEIQRLRLEEHLSQQEIAEQFGISRSRVQVILGSGTGYYGRGGTRRKANSTFSDEERKARKSERQKRYYRKLRKRVIEAYGGQCACCGETTYEFLTIDHINNDGAEHRKRSGGKGASFYLWIVKNNFPDNLQVLCYNCNNAKAVYGYCPHQQ